MTTETKKRHGPIPLLENPTEGAHIKSMEEYEKVPPDQLKRILPCNTLVHLIYKCSKVPLNQLKIMLPRETILHLKTIRGTSKT